jgi:hypothetical protein
VAISQRDYPVMQGIFLVITMSVILANLLADFSTAGLTRASRLDEDWQSDNGWFRNTLKRSRQWV